MRKAHKIAKDLGISFKELQDLSEDVLDEKIKAASSYVENEDIDKLMAATSQEIKVKEPLLPKGAFVGIVYDPEKKRYLSVSVRLSLDNLGMLEHKMIGEHTSVHGGMIELHKYFTREIGPNTVDTEVK